MERLEILREQLSKGAFDFSQHAFKRTIAQNISIAEIQEAGKLVSIIEDYLNDKYAPSCLLLGFTIKKRPLHVQIVSQYGMRSDHHFV